MRKPFRRCCTQNFCVMHALTRVRACIHACMRVNKEVCTRDTVAPRATQSYSAAGLLSRNALGCDPSIQSPAGPPSLRRRPTVSRYTPQVAAFQTNKKKKKEQKGFVLPLPLPSLSFPWAGSLFFRAWARAREIKECVTRNFRGVGKKTL